VIPLLLMLAGGVVQYGALMATQHTLTQVGRDLGRWIATQDATDCIDLGTGSPSPVAKRADATAAKSSLMGFTTGAWEASFISYGYGAMPATAASTEGVEVAWVGTPATCPPDDSTVASFVSIRLSHRAPVILPGFAYLPGVGTCDSAGCYLVQRTTATFRMEPQAQPAVTTP
jgi:Flp pilus assembly protein TadG